MYLVLFACFVAAVAALSVVYASFSEWVLHRYVMHRPVGKFRYPFEAHALTHHRLFKADASYHLQDPAIRHKIPMAWWNGAAIILIGGMPLYLIGFVLSLVWFGGGVAVAATGAAVFAGYYAAYEYLHWCMHLPKHRRIERSWLFRRLNAHHLLHHRYMDKNLNVVLPLADWTCATLLLRAKTAFAQVRGPSVPDVQPAPA